MLIKVLDPNFQTIIFLIIFTAALLASIKRGGDSFFSKDTTNQIKGFAILAVVFSHIGLFLTTSNQFLYPLSILGGVGVNLFFFLSGFGLTLSQLRSPLSPLSFFKKRLFRLLIPLWLVIILILMLDAFLIQKSYPVKEIINSFLGVFPRADLFANLNSPLWYFTPILFYYLIFPLLFIRKVPLLSPVLVLLASLLMINLPLPVHQDVLKLYKLHYLAFPSGMFLALIIPYLNFKLNRTFKLLGLAAFVVIFLYTSINSGVGQDLKTEHGISLITTLSLVFIFSLSKLKFKLFSIFGVFSYEIYLLHWPILSRHNLFLSLPPFLIVVVSLILLVILGYALQKLVEKMAKHLPLT